MVKTLPRMPSEINMVIIRKAGETGSNGKDFLVRRFVIQDWLRFLKKYNQSPGYKNVQISQSRIDSLPTNAEIEGIQIIESPDDIDIEENCEVSDQNEIENVDHILSQNMQRSLSFQDTIEPEHICDKTNHTGIICPLRERASEIDSINDIINGYINRLLYKFF